jgi:hypothetical protein
VITVAGIVGYAASGKAPILDDGYRHRICISRAIQTSIDR